MAATDLPPLLGESPAFMTLAEQISRVAPLDRPVLVIGERGTGKELVAARLHFLSRRWDGPFVKLNCAALAESLLETELFGHEAGAFTGAVKRRSGRFEIADSGSLFLDEIASSSPAVQEKLLRAIEYGAFERVGGNATLEVDVRVIGATNEDLPAAAAAGRFRADLLDRLAFEVITLPPLRARPEDIPLLARHFGREMAKELDWPQFPGFSEAAMERLLAHDWPGNVRELMNVVERVVALTPSGGVADFPDIRMRAPRQRLAALIPERPSASLREMVSEFEKRVIAQNLERHGGNRSRAARELGITRQGLSVKIKKYGL